jgi:hypothetical protein
MDPVLSARAESTRAELHAVRVRRAELRETLNLLEAALAAPARGRAVVWGEAVHASLVMLADDFSAHVDVTEGPDGLHQAILAGDLRLANAVHALTADHAALAAQIQALITELDGARSVPRPDTAAVREHAAALLEHLARHRQQGADLIYEAYQTDLGGGD